MFKDVFAKTVFLLIGLAVCGLSPVISSAAEPQLKLEFVARGFNSPVFVTAPPGETEGRVFVVEQKLSGQSSGRIRIIKLATKTIETTPFLMVPGLATGTEQGLLGLAFHPNYAQNGYFYVNYTVATSGATEITRYKANGDNPLLAMTADAASKTVILRYDQPEANHNGGWVGFGPDGYLYIGSGDGGGANDQHGAIGNGQNRATLLGKILRIDVDNAAAPKLYGIPEGNPFKGNTAGYREEIWAFGLRNPWRCSFDAENGNLWIGDVGQISREEIDVTPAGQGGLNFGWRPREGFIQNPAFPNENPVTPKIDPVFDYGRTLGVSVTGGYVYRGNAIPEFKGAYIMGDYGSARFWLLNYTGTSPAASREITSQINPGTSATKPVRNISSFGHDASGELYVCDYSASNGEIYKIVSAVIPIQITTPTLNGNRLNFSFNATAGAAYVVEGKTSLDAGTPWQTIEETPVAASSTQWTVFTEMNSAQKFIRVRTK